MYKQLISLNKTEMIKSNQIHSNQIRSATMVRHSHKFVPYRPRNYIPVWPTFHCHENKWCYPTRYK